MQVISRIEPIDALRGWAPREVLAAWPRDRYVAALISCDADPRLGRWSMLAEPCGPIDADAALRRLDELVPHDDTAMGDRRGLPFVGGYIAILSYELGAVFEPAVGFAAPAAPATLTLLECPEALLFDHHHRQWWRIGECDIVSDLQARHDAPEPGEATALSMLTTDAEHRAAIERTIEYIRAGDIFQANITRCYAATVAGDPRRLAAAAFEVALPRYGAYIELRDGGRIISMSPELFLDVDAITRRVLTRPVKGTRSGGDDPLDLWESEKDAAELHMIVDLMRNDLGRVCAFSSVSVNAGRVMESFPTVHHGVAEISGRLRSGVSIGGLLRAAFPAGSITGAPKIRAMQIISELERDSRGIYCGAIGFIDRRGSMTLSVAIRTMVLEPTPGTADRYSLRYGAGGGIVADSDPHAELRECDQKVEVLRRTLERFAATPSRAQ